MGDFLTEISRERSLPLRDASVPLRREFSPPVDLPDRTEELYEIGALLTADLDASILLEDTYHWRRWLPSETDPSPWTKSATIRHANQIELSFLRLIVPEDPSILGMFLLACFSDISEHDAAKQLLTLLSDDNFALSTSLTLDSRLGSINRDPICGARIAVFFRSSLRPVDWQITRQLVMLFCSTESRRALAEVANTDISDSLWLTGNELATETIVEAINKLHFISGMLSARLALSRLPLCLTSTSVSPAGADFRYSWARYCPQTEAAPSADYLSQVTARLISEEANGECIVPDVVVPFVQKQRLSYIIQAEQSTDKSLFRTLALPDYSTLGIVIKKHAASWPVEAPDFCFLVMDETADFDDERQLGQLLDEANLRKEWYGVEKKGARFSLEDKEFIKQWVLALAQATQSDDPPDS